MLANHTFGIDSTNDTAQHKVDSCLHRLTAQNVDNVDQHNFPSLQQGENTIGSNSGGWLPSGRVIGRLTASGLEVLCCFPLGLKTSLKKTFH
jgi:hypothetical protein